MIRRGVRLLPSLSKSRSKVTLVGGTQSLSEVCLGYMEGENGLALCPAPASKAVGSLTSEGLYSIERHSSMGFTVLLYSSGSAYLFTDGQISSCLTELPAGQPFSVESRDENGHLLIGIVSADKLCVYDCYSGESDIYDLPSVLYGGIAHCGRLFAVDKGGNCRIVWSGFKMTDWQDGIDGSGYVNLEGSLGDIQRLENFGDDVLCVREYGFTVIKALADSRNFRIAPSQYCIKTGAKINLGGVYGHTYYFSTINGLYSFDGSGVKREYTVGGLLTKVGRVYVLGDGFVYADCVYDGAECIMRYDTQSGTAVFFALGCSHPFISKGELFCIKGGRFYGLSTENVDSSRIWRSQPIGGLGRKTLKCLYVDADQTPVITVVGEGVRLNIEGTGRIPVNLSGQKIYVEISGNAAVKSVVAELEERK